MVQHQWNALPRLKTQIEAKLVHAMVQPNHFETVRLVSLYFKTIQVL